MRCGWRFDIRANFMDNLSTTVKKGEGEMDTDLMFSSQSDEWETPEDFYQALHEEFNFTLDPCSTHDNHKCSKYYTIEDDGLSKSWEGETVFVNPPYGRVIGEWVKKCYEESKHATVVLLMPARTDTRYFHDYIYYDADEIRFLRGRLKFINRSLLTASPAPFPSMVVVFYNKKER